VDKTRLAQLIFSNATKRQVLENILHPLLFREVRARIKQSKCPVVVLEAPLLFEAGWDQYTDLNIVVLADPKTLPARLKERKLTRAEYNRRTKQQLPDLQKAQRGDVVFFHSTKAQLKKSVERFCSVLEVLPHQ
jgi:dephospho-CoA kinase